MATTPRSRTPAGGKTATASPEVRAALKALKARAQRPSHERSPSSTQTITPRDEVDDMGLPSLKSVLEKARTTGRCNIASRSLEALPAELFSMLLPRTSEYHPSNRAPKHFTLPNIIDLSIADREDDTARWYEAKELTVLKASSNEIESVEEALSGFIALESLDLHHNKLQSLPTQLALLGNLTSLKLSHNRFEAIPIQLLALDGLTELDLSDNAIASLWPPNWREPLKELMTPEDGDDTVSPNTSGGSDFWSAFPSSPTKPRRSETPLTAAPFPLLRTLSLGKNRLRSEVFAQEGFSLPESLQRLDLSCNHLATPLPVPAFIRCRNLVTLELQGNELIEPVFADRDPTQEPFASLREIDLSSNGIDDLSALEALFAHRSAQWLGLPRTVPQHAPPTGAGGLRVKLTGNPLRNEAARRKAAKAAAAAKPKPTPVRAVPAPTSVAAKRTMSPLARVEPNEEEEEPVEEVATVVETNGVANSVLAEAMDSKGDIFLAGRSLSEVPLDGASTGFAPHSLDASRNSLSTFPFDELAAHPWSASLRRLCLSRNRLAALTFASSTVLPSLTELDLSANRLSDASIFTGIAATCPSLELLDLTFNSLASVDGVEALLLPSAEGKRGVRVLKLGSNQLVELGALVETALKVRSENGGSWACDELDLRDNAIAKLPAELGLLPLQFLGVSGNLFRVPQRKVYDDGGSTANLLKWLKDRL